MGADGAPTKSELLRTNARGQFIATIQSCLKDSPEFVGGLAQFLLNAHFPDSLHQDILVAVGLNVIDDRAVGGGRDPNFRRLVLTAYNHQCAICGLQILLSGTPIALEAAHIRWHQAKGPSSVQNGLSLCCLHHKVFDLGAITINTDLTIAVSDQVSGLSGFVEHLMAHHGREIRLPTHKSDIPSREFIEWHHEEVFRGNPRPL